MNEYAIILQREDETPDEWARLIAEFERQPHIAVEHLEDGSVGIRWV